MSSPRYPRYFYGHIEFPTIDINNNKGHNCNIDAFFQFYCSVVTSRSNNYMARLPTFNQCLLTTDKNNKIIK